LPHFRQSWHNPVVDTFPDLSRRPAIKTRTSLPADPTLRDPMQSGAEATSLQFPRARRQWDITIEHLTWEDVEKLDDFVRHKACYGANPFFFRDARNPRNPKNLVVKFSVCPSSSDSVVEGEIRQTCTFQLREV